MGMPAERIPHDPAERKERRADLHRNGGKGNHRRKQQAGAGLLPDIFLRHQKLDLSDLTRSGARIKNDFLPKQQLVSLKAGFNSLSFSNDVCLGCSSLMTITGSPFLCGTDTGIISSLNLPDSVAWADL